MKTNQLPVVSDAELRRLASDARILAEELDEPQGWAARWISHLLEQDHEASNWPAEMNKALQIALISNHAVLEGRFARKQGRPIGTCPYPSILFDASPLIRFQAEYWSIGYWMEIPTVARNLGLTTLDHRTQECTERLIRRSVVSTPEYEKQLGNLMISLEGFSDAVDLTVSGLALSTSMVASPRTMVCPVLIDSETLQAQVLYKVIGPDIILTGIELLRAKPSQ